MPASHKSDNYIKITNVSRTTKQNLINIAKNQGVDLGSFLKVKLREIEMSYPPEMKQPPRPY